MNTEKAKAALYDPECPIGVAAKIALEQHLAAHDTEEARLKGMEQQNLLRLEDIKAAEKRIADLEVVAREWWLPKAAEVKEMKARIAKLEGKPAEPQCACVSIGPNCSWTNGCPVHAEPPCKLREMEQWICEYAGKCGHTSCVHQVAHERNGCPDHERFSLCFPDSRCIPLSEFNRRKEAEKEAAAKEEWEKNAKEGATVEITKRPCFSCGMDDPVMGKTGVLVWNSTRAYWTFAAGNYGPVKVCHLCAKVVAPPKDGRVPEPGDIVANKQAPGWQGRVLFTDGPHIYFDRRNYEMAASWRILSRPALVPGEGVTHREHPEWGVGYICKLYSDDPVRANFCIPPSPGEGYVEYDLSAVKRDSWHPELHEGKV